MDAVGKTRMDSYALTAHYVRPVQEITTGPAKISRGFAVSNLPWKPCGPKQTRATLERTNVAVMCAGAKA